MSKANQFVVDSNGRCFLCMNTISNLSTPLLPVKLERGSESVLSNSVYSLQCFSRYMEMDMGKVFREKDSIPAYLLAQVKRSELKVGLCGDCANLTENFSRLYQQLEKIEMEMTVYAKLIHQKLRKADTPNEFNSIGKLEVAKVLRSEATEKCSKKLHTVVPRAKFQNLTLNQLNRIKRKYKPRPDLSQSENVSKSETSFEQWPDVRQDSSSPTNFNNDNDDYEMNHYADVSDPDISEHLNQPSDLTSTEGAEVVIKKERGVDNYPAVVVGPLKRSEAIINPDTGKYKCGLCSKEFSLFGGLTSHFKSVHLKMRHKCKVCKQEFNHRGDLNIHTQSIHMGVRFKCNGCERMFTQKRHLKHHQNKTNCGVTSGHL